ncbi:MAG: hypothetical protein R2783_10470 [Gelidibacter sp.]
MDHPIDWASILKILKIQTLSASISGNNFEVTDVEGFKYLIKFGFGLSLKSNLIRVIVKLRVLAKSKAQEGSEANCEMTISFVYHLENLADFVDHEKKEVDANLGDVLVSISFSTSRGIFNAFVQGSVFQHFIFPIVNPKDIVEGVEGVSFGEDEIGDLRMDD